MKLLLTLFTCLAISFGYAQTTYIHCGNLIDGKSDKVQKKVTIVVEGNTISKVAKDWLAPTEGVQLIDLSRKTVMPGLMDMHVHLEGEMTKDSYTKRFTDNKEDIAYASVKFAEITLMSGFTTVRDLGGSGVNIALRKAINRGDVVGPRVYTAGKSIAITGGHADPTNGFRQDLMGDPGPDRGVVNGLDDCRKAVRQRYKNGADLIKITATGGVLSVAKDGSGPHFSEEEMAMIVQTANDLDMRVAAHAHGDEGMQRAVRAGVTSIEHGTLMSEATMELMIEHGTWYVPTITAGKSVADSAAIPKYFPDLVTPKALHIGPKIQETFGKAYKKGVKIAFGTDAGVFRHGKNAYEFLYMVEAGMPPMAAIKSATINSAELLGIADKVGTIEPGKWADIVAVDDNPLDHMKTMLNITFVMKNGVVYQQK